MAEVVFEHAPVSDSRDIWKCGTVNTRGYFSGILVTNRAGAWGKKSTNLPSFTCQLASEKVETMQAFSWVSSFGGL